MSAERTAFEKAARGGAWGTAFQNLNALSMEEMLASLSSLPAATLDNLIQRRFAYKAGVGMPRMEYAWTVVKTRKLPLVAPDDLLQTGQVGTAAGFLKTTAPAGPRVTLRLIVFTDSIVKNRGLFAELKKKAEQVLASQGNGFKLDVFTCAMDIALQEEVYLIPQLENMLELAKNVMAIPADRVPVLVVRIKANVDIHGVALPISGRRVAVVDTDSPNPDRATLLHELGHCAGLPHAGQAPAGKPSPVDVGDVTNIMAEPVANVTRDKLTVTQGEFLAKASFAATTASAAAPAKAAP
jgi:hypothetical protein